jgi:hypothetical protein
MKEIFLDTLRLGFLVKIMSQNKFFTLFPLPEFVEFTGNGNELDIDITRAPKDFVLKFFIGRNSTELREGNFYAISNTADSVHVEQHINHNPTGNDLVLEKNECYLNRGEDIGISSEFMEILESLFEVRQ